MSDCVALAWAISSPHQATLHRASARAWPVEGAFHRRAAYSDAQYPQREEHWGALIRKWSEE